MAVLGAGLKPDGRAPSRPWPCMRTAQGPAGPRPRMLSLQEPSLLLAARGISSEDPASASLSAGNSFQIVNGHLLLMQFCDSPIPILVSLASVGHRGSVPNCYAAFVIQTAVYESRIWRTSPHLGSRHRHMQCSDWGCFACKLSSFELLMHKTRSASDLPFA